jgi:hypothetical protein
LRKGAARSLGADQPRPPAEPDDGKGDRQRRQRGHGSEGEVVKEAERIGGAAADRADQDVLRVADQGRRRPGVARRRQRDEIGPHVEATSRQAGTQNRRHREHHHVVGQHRREAAGDQDGEGEQAGRTGSGSGDAGRRPIVEARMGELAGQQHQREQQLERRRIDQIEHPIGPHGATEQQRGEPDQRDAGPVELEPGHPSDGHAEIGQGEDRDGQAGLTHRLDTAPARRLY